MKNLKLKLLISFVLAILLATSLRVVNRFAFAESIFYFQNGTIYGFNSEPNEDVNLIIPDKIDDVPVTKLLLSQGAGINFNQTSVKDYIVSLDLSSATNLTEIGNVFSGCSNLSGTLVIPSNVKNIHRKAFKDTNIDKVILNHTDDSLTIGDNSFPANSTIVFQSIEVMISNLFKETETDVWAQYNVTYLYDLTIDLGYNTLTTIKVEKGSTLGDDYDRLINTYFSGNDSIVLYQGSNIVDRNTVLDGTTLKTSSPSIKYDYEYAFYYGWGLNIEANYVEGDELTWSYNDNIISTKPILELGVLDVGEYIYTCTITKQNGASSSLTYKVVIMPNTYDFYWPLHSRFEYFDMSEDLFLDESEKEQFNISYYKFDGTTYNPVDSFSIGQFKAVVEPKNENYAKITNNTFEFTIDYSYLTIVWENPVFNYTGEFITPSFYLYGETKGQVVEIMIEDSVLSARDTGEYQICVTGLSNPYFALTEETLTTYNWEIITTNLDIDWKTKEIEYIGGKNFSINGVYNDLSIPLELKGTDGENIIISGVGTYEVVVQVPSKYTGFTLNGNTRGTIKVVPSKLDVVFNCNNSYTYNGDYVEILATITTEISDNVQLILEDNYYKDAGKYTAVVKGVNNPNYYVDEVTFEWEIAPKMLLVNWNRTAFTYTGIKMSPQASVDTGIEGESLKLQIITENNINANEDEQVGYKATALLPEGVTNYILSNTEVHYFILRATPSLTLNSQQEVVYNGENQLPEYELVGDNNALKILINGAETTTGVKEIGNYIIEFKHPKSTNYKELIGDYVVNFTIKAVSKTNAINKLNVNITSPNGFYTNDLFIEEITEHYIETKNDIAKQTDYKLYKAIQISFGEDTQDTKITLSINRVDSSKIKVFELSGRNLKEISLEYSKNGISFEGGEGTYYVFVEKTPWLFSPVGIITMTITVLLVVGGFVYLTMFKNSHQRKIKLLVEHRLQDKINNGEEITSDMILKIRKEVEEEIKHNKENAEKQ